MDHYGLKQGIHTMKQDRLKYELKRYLNSKLLSPIQTVEDIHIERAVKTRESYVINITVACKANDTEE